MQNHDCRPNHACDQKADGDVIGNVYGSPRHNEMDDQSSKRDGSDCGHYFQRVSPERVHSGLVNRGRVAAQITFVAVGEAFPRTMVCRSLLHRAQPRRLGKNT